LSFRKKKEYRKWWGYVSSYVGKQSIIVPLFQN
jgi:hypothetical protein